MHVDFVEDNESWADRALTGALGAGAHTRPVSGSM